MRGWGCLKAFTILSNVFAAIVSGVILLDRIMKRRRDFDFLPRWITVLHYCAATSVGLTFLVVVFFLGPMFQFRGMGYFTMFSGNMFFFHLVNPLLCMAALVLEEQPQLGGRENLLALIPTMAYSVVYLVMVVFLGRWSDFYNFTFGGHYALAPAVMLVMYLVTYLVAYALRRVHNRFTRT